MKPRQRGTRRNSDWIRDRSALADRSLFIVLLSFLPYVEEYSPVLFFIRMSAETPVPRALLVEYHRQHTGGATTGAEASILGMLSSRGFPVQSYGTAHGKDSAFAYLTILLGECDESRFKNVLQQLGKIVTVMRAESRDLMHVTQDLNARITGLTDKERGHFRTKHTAHIHRTALFVTPERAARSITRDLLHVGANFADVVRIDLNQPIEAAQERTVQEACALFGEYTFPAGHHLLKIRMRQPNTEVEHRVSERSGKFRSMEYVRKTGDVPHVENLASSLRSPEYAARVEYLTVGAPRTSVIDKQEI